VVKRGGMFDADHSPPSGAEVKNETFPHVCVVVSGQLYFTFAKSNKVCVSVVNEVCVVIMLKIQVMYIIFQ
jgi:hypothetical protein